MYDKVMHGVVHGKVIELDDDTGVSDGERVEVVVRRIVPNISSCENRSSQPDDASWAEWEAIMHQVQRERTQERRNQWGDP
jgi:ABC-type phosphate transport system auxiliary subunit